MRRILTKLGALSRELSGPLRVFISRCVLVPNSIPRSTKLSRGVRLRATDGARIRLRDHVAIDRFADVTAKHGRLDIGARSYIGQYSVICAREAVTIGADCLIAEHVTIRDQDHDFGPGLITAQAGFTTSPVVIGNNVWIGAKVTVTKGVTIGDNAVIGANSVVTEDISANTVAVGAPARVIRVIRDVS